MTDTDTAIRWRKSSYSNGSGGNCVELAHTLGAVRDSKNGDVLNVRPQAVARLLASVKHSS
ncbi:MAG: DUF397 domain-containing protein [Sciscionella sp.]